ncbi:MFS transporter [Candidatus Entotheonella palauensis]|nr:MFS transporter [Candidatus Entotheonella palauensis]
MDTSASLSAGLTLTPKRGWLVALLSRMQQSSFALLSYSFGMFFPFIRDDLNLSPWQAGVLQGVWWLSTALLALPCGMWFSRYRPIPLISVSLMLGLPFIFLQGLSHSFWVLLLARFGIVVSFVLATPARPLIMQQWVAPPQYALVQSIGLSLHSVLLATAISSSVFLITFVGSWRYGYMALGVFFVLHALTWISVAREKAAPVKGLQRALQSYREPLVKILWKYPQGWLIGITMFALSATWTGVVTFLPTLLLEQHGMALTVSGPILGCLYYILIPASPLGGWLSKNVTNRRYLLLVPAICNVVFGIAITFTSSPWGLMLLLTGMGSIWIVSSVLEVLPFEFPGIQPREVAVIASLLRLLMGVGFATGPMLVGWVATQTASLQTGLLVLALFTGTGVITAWFYPSPKPPDQEGAMPSSR